MRLIFATEKIKEKSLKTTFFIEESLAPHMSHEEITSQQAILFDRRKFSLSSFVTGMGLSKTADRIFQNLFRGLP